MAKYSPILVQEFHSKWNFPNCCGASDGKHITIQASSNCGSEYYNHKETNIIVMKGVVEHNYFLEMCTYAHMVVIQLLV